MPHDECSYELATRLEPASTEEEVENGTRVLQQTPHETNEMEDESLTESESLEQVSRLDEQLNRRTLRKLDFILLPFLSTLFLLNSVDKSNIGNAESAGFTKDVGLSPNDLNTSLALFFAFFVALQPVGAALGRKYGMTRWVPACMSLWGACTLLHIWVNKRWQLLTLRIAIATLEAGFYPTTVSYLSLFYTRYEFAVRLGFFYGQTAVAGVVGGVLSWAIFERFPARGSDEPSGEGESKDDWRSWEVLFLIEGCLTMAIALIGFFWLPHSADTAWFLTKTERKWAEKRIRLDQNSAAHGKSHADQQARDYEQLAETETNHHQSADEEDHAVDDRAGLLHPRHRSPPRRRKMSTVSAVSLTADSGLSRHDVFSAVAQYKIWHLLICNILSAIPATAFGVFLPLVMKQLSPRLNLSPAASNLLSAPPFACGAIVLFLFTRWSDRSQQRLIPILWGLALLLVGLTLTVMTPTESYVLRYMSLCVLLSGSFVASPLTVAWLTNNTPEPGKRAILLGINGWGNLAGVFSALLFTPEDEKEGYVRPFVVTLVCVGLAFAGFAVFRVLLIGTNERRDAMTAHWDDEDRAREELIGDVPVQHEVRQMSRIWRKLQQGHLLDRFGLDAARKGDDKLTFRYGL